jgi:hypothetical protein
MNESGANPNGDALQWELVDDELLVLDAPQGTVYRFSGDEPSQLRVAARDLISSDSDLSENCELADLAELGGEQQRGLMSRRTLMKTSAAAGILIGFTALRLPTAAAQASGDTAPTALAAITSATSAEVIGSP